LIITGPAQCLIGPIPGFTVLYFLLQGQAFAWQWARTICQKKKLEIGSPFSISGFATNTKFFDSARQTTFPKLTQTQNTPSWVQNLFLIGGTAQKRKKEKSFPSENFSFSYFAIPLQDFLPSSKKKAMGSSNISEV